MMPRLLREPKRHAVVVVDILRATTSLVTMFEAGLLRAIISDNLKQARVLAANNFSLLCGEVDGVPPQGFDYGNSPSEFAGLSFKGKSAVLFTTNGTAAINIAAEAPVVIAASLLNRKAAARRAVEEAVRRKLDIAIVCSGVDGGTAFSLEDTAAAGAIVESVCEIDGTISTTDEAYAALHLWRWYHGDAMCMFRESAHARTLRSIGFESDLLHAAQLDVIDAVPVLYEDRGLKVLRVTSPRWRR